MRAIVYVNGERIGEARIEHLGTAVVKAGASASVILAPDHPDHDPDGEKVCVLEGLLEEIA